MYSYFHQYSVSPIGAFSSQKQYHYYMHPDRTAILPRTQFSTAVDDAAAANRPHELTRWQKLDKAFFAPIYGASAFDRPLAALDPKEFDWWCNILLLSAIYYCKDIITDVGHREPDMFHPVVPTPDADTGTTSTQLISLEQCSSSASAGTPNNFQENSEHAMSDSGVAALNQFQTVATPMSSSSSSTSSSPPPTTPPEDDKAKPQRRRPGRKNAPSSTVACTFPGCKLAYSRVPDRDRHMRTCHDPDFERWYCPGLETGCCPIYEGFKRHDQILAHVRKEPGSACYQAAMALRWHPYKRGSVCRLKGYRPPWMRT